MEILVYEGKNLNELKEKAFSELNASENELYIRETEEVKGLLKTKKYKLEILTKDDVVKYIKNYIIDVAKNMGITVNIEAKKRENYIQINLFSENSSILIGKNGRTMEALQYLIKNSIFNKTGFKINVILDVEDYKEKINKHLEYNVKKIAREVRKTGVDAKLDPMNSYERRIVHNAVNEIKGVSTISEGVEPNRYVVIKKDEQ
ncbi:MAG: KH domain-containing protein [Tenericutes bacterium]|nr:KH domain-containing protein [Mycoplasmatota bacterium]MDD7630056.1 KH domain-containing protein [bacterium]MDY4108841.1 RNA-binding cell elongation regulator Jag/EloR [Bacilli bacterium]